MPKEYPPVIDPAAFRPPQPPDVTVEEKCALSQLTCSLTGLALGPGLGLAGTSFHAGQREPLNFQKGQAGRYRLAPGAEVQPINIQWTLDGCQYIEGAVLELFQATGVQTPAFWTKALQWPGGVGQSAAATTPFSGKLVTDVAEATASSTDQVIIGYNHVAEFPVDFLTAQSAPYLLRMTITSVRTARLIIGVRWIYIDVEVGEVRVYLGHHDMIPVEGAGNRMGFNARNRRLHQQMDAKIPNTKRVEIGVCPTIPVPLDGTMFGAGSDEWSDNTSYQAWQDRWNPGPYVPLVVKAKVFTNGGALVDAPMAMADARFFWNWAGETALDVSSVHALSKRVVTDAYNFQLADWMAGGINTHTDCGGKRGPGASLFKTTDIGYQQAQPTPGAFPFQMEAGGTRAGTAFSYGREATDPYRGFSGTVLTPSIIAGDRIRLAAYFAYGPKSDWDTVHGGAWPPWSTPREVTGRFETQRVVRVSKHRMPAGTGLGSFTWPGVAVDFEQSGITLDYSAVDGNPTVLGQNAYRGAFTNAVNALPLSQKAMFAPVNEQLTAQYALKMRTYDQYAAELNARYNAILNGVLLQNLGQQGGLPANFFDRIQARASWYAELVGWNNVNAFVASVQNLRLVPWPNINAGEMNALGQFQFATPPDNAVTPFVTSNATAVGEAAALAGILAVAAVSQADYATVSVNVAQQIVFEILKTFTDADDDGIQVFHFDFVSNFDQYKDSGYAFATPSNRTTCPECGQALGQNDRDGRACPNGACGAVLRTNASIVTLVPWKYMKPYEIGIWKSLQNKSDEYFLLTNMANPRPEILVAHEMGHHLFLPHAPQPFTPGDISSWMIRNTLGVFLRFSPGTEQKLIQGTTPSGDKAAFHSSSHRACMMGYNAAQMENLHFCAKCTLRLRGWNCNEVAAIRG